MNWIDVVMGWCFVTALAIGALRGQFGLGARYAACLWGHLHTLWAARLVCWLVALTARDGEPVRWLAWASTCDTDEFTDPRTGAKLRVAVNLHGDQDWLDRLGPEGVTRWWSMTRWVWRNAGQFCAYRWWGVRLDGRVWCVLEHELLGDRHRRDVLVPAGEADEHPTRGPLPRAGAPVLAQWRVLRYRLLGFLLEGQFGWKRRAHDPVIEGQRWAKISCSPGRRAK